MSTAMETSPATVNEQRPSSQSSDAVPAFGALLATWREQCGLSMNQLAARSGIDHSVISRWECGERNPKRSTLCAIADVLDITGVNRMLLFASAGFYEQPPDIDQLELIETIMALDADELHVVRMMLAGFKAGA